MQLQDIKEHGLYIVSDQYFRDFPSSTWVQNKSESRPHYYAIPDCRGLLWMLPLSSRVENHRGRITAYEARHGHGSCDTAMIASIHGKDRVLLIGSMFPVTPNYIVRAYCIGSRSYIVRNKAITKAVHSKATRFLALLNNNIIPDKNGVLSIANQLLTRSLVGV